MGFTKELREIVAEFPSTILFQDPGVGVYREENFSKLVYAPLFSSTFLGILGIPDLFSFVLYFRKYLKISLIILFHLLVTSYA